jgi:hypothetical protein
VYFNNQGVNPAGTINLINHQPQGSYIIYFWENDKNATGLFLHLPSGHRYISMSILRTQARSITSSGLLQPLPTKEILNPFRYNSISKPKTFHGGIFIQVHFSKAPL